MRRLAAAFALAICLVGCGSTPAPTGDVRIVTDGVLHTNADGEFEIGCTLMPTYAELVADPRYGVAFKGTGKPAIWPSGYTGHRVGSEVEVRDPWGHVAATTGVGLQDIFWIGNLNGTPTNVICQAFRSAEHLQPSHARASSKP